MRTRSLITWPLAAATLLSSAFSARSAITSVVETGRGADAAAVIGVSFGEDTLTFSDRPHQHNGAAFNAGTGLLATNGTVIVPLPSYLTGNNYVRFANDARDNAGYSAVITADVPTVWYLLVDNRLNGPAATGTDPNTDDPVLGGTLQWVLDGGWQRVNTGISPNGQADYTGVDETGADNGTVGPGVGLNQFYAVYKLPSASTQITVRNNGIAGQNNIAVVGVPVPPVDDPIASFQPQPSTISPGESTTLSWIIDPAATAGSIDNGIGNILPLTGPGGIGSTAVSPGVDATYTLSVTTPGGAETAPATVQVRPIASFQANATIIDSGDAVTLSWRIRTDAAVSLSGHGDMAANTAPDGTGSFSVSPAVSTDYTLTAIASGRTQTSTLRVAVRPSGTTYALIDIGGTEGQVEPGAAGGFEVGAGVNNTNLTNLPPVTLTSNTADEFTLAIDNIDTFGSAVGGLDWRDRGTAPSVPYAFLAEDFVKNNGGVIRVTLGGLPAGTYDAISFHLDPQNSQCAAIQILVTDATGVAVDTGVRGNASFSDHPNNTFAPQVAGLTTGLVDSKGARFSITSDGVNDVLIFFDGRAQAGIDVEVPLDALWLTQAGPPGPGGVIEVINVGMTSAGGFATVAIEFASTPGNTYRVRSSPDLITWTNLNPNFPASAGASTTFTDAGIPLGTPRQFYQIIQN